MEDSFKTKLNFSRSALFQMKTRVFLKYFVRSCSLLGNLLSGKGAIAKRKGRGIVRARYGAKRAGYGLKKILTPPHPLTNFEI